MRNKITYAVPFNDTVKVYTLHIDAELIHQQRCMQDFEEAILKKVLREMDSRRNGLNLEQRESYEMSLDMMGWTYVSSGYDDEGHDAQRVWWMINNCNKAFTRSGTGHYWFEDSTEASFFKLQWVKSHSGVS